MTSDHCIRTATPEDAEALLDIYRPLVENTAVSFEYEPPPVEVFRQRIEQSLRHWDWLVARHGGEPVGYAYATAYKTRDAYRWSVEVSLYVAPRAQRRGIGKGLYGQLINRITENGFCNAYAGIVLPNAPSVALHRKLGFRPVGLYEKIGWKFNRWHDVEMYHLRLREFPKLDFNSAG